MFYLKKHINNLIKKKKKAIANKSHNAYIHNYFFNALSKCIYNKYFVLSLK